MATEVPDIVGDSTAVIGLAITAITLVSLLLGLLWKAFRLADQVQDMAKEMKPNHGSSLRDQIDAVRIVTESNAQAIANHVEVSAAAMADMDRNNTDAHAAIHRRVDGLFTLLAGPNTARIERIHEWHHTQRDTTEEV